MLLSLSRLVTCAIITTCLLVSATASAQGTATGPTTTHEYTATGQVWIGGPNDAINGPNPYPIDLDVNGTPWIKQVYTPSSGNFFGGGMSLHETIVNAGTEPWWDWHEKVNSFAIGAGFNLNQITMSINGQPITFNSGFSGGFLTLDSFSQPVLPGDVLQIDKSLITTDNVVGSNTLLVTIEQFPTPEPASLALLGLGALAVLRYRR